MAFPAILATMLPGLISKGVEIFDRKFQSDAEKEEAIREHTREIQREIEGAWDKEQEHLTRRHEADMSSGSWLSSNIRPLTLVYLIALFTIAFFTAVPDTILELLKELMMTVFVFYFGARTLDKATTIVMNGLKK